MSTVPEELDRRFREAAVAAALVDVVWDAVDSPLGQLLLAATPRGLCAISYEPEAHAALDALASRFGPRVLGARAPLAPAERALDEYFAGRRTAFDLPLDLGGLPPFQLEILREPARVPFGQTVTYGTLAARAGHPGAARAVGGAMNRNPIPIVLPCHRVVGASGALVGYAGGLERKRTLLALEGVLPAEL
jgi:methylated-DNA-[protein]-cysteine S-methyltransferase